MMIAYIRGKEIVINNRITKLSELYTKEFYSYINDNDVAKKYCFGTPADNVIYFFHVLPMLALYYFFYKHGVDEIVVDYAESDDCHRIMNVASLMKIKCNLSRHWFLYQIFYIRDYLVIFLTTIYLIVLELFVKGRGWENNPKDKIVLIRSKITKGKMPISPEDFVLEETSIGKGSFFQEISYFARAKLIIVSWMNAMKMYRKLKHAFQNQGLEIMGLPALHFLSFRLVHINLWGQVLDVILKKYPETQNVITGAYLDSYSQIEQEIVRKNGRKLIVIPHGLEDRIIYPCGLAGDVFYSTSVAAKNILNQLYHTKKFVYEEELLFKMYRINNQVGKGAKYIYITSGTNNEVDYKIISHIAQKLEERNIPLYMKFKPGYDASLFNNINNTRVIDSIVDTLCGNVCISRGSAVLVEALYNDSIAIQIILPEDGIMRAQMVPSLADDKILHLYSFKEVDAWLGSQFDAERRK